MILKSILILLLLVFTKVLYCQHNPLDEKYTPKNLMQLSSASREINYPAHSIKFNPGLLIRSIAGIYYEYNQREEFSLIFGIGLCFNKDNIYIKTDDLIFSEKKDYNEPYYLRELYQKGKLANSQPYFFAGLRYFFPSGNFFQIEMWNYSHKINVNIPEVIMNSNFIGNEINPFSFSFYCLRFGGVSIINKGKLVITNEFSTMVGLRMSSAFPLFQQEDSFAGNTFYTLSSDKKINIRPVVGLTYVIGIGISSAK